MSTQSRIGLEVHNENLPLKAPFRISGYTFHDSPVTLVTLRDGSVEGRGEAAGVYYLNDTTDRMLATIEAHRGAIEYGPTREELRSLLPPGGGRRYGSSLELKRRARCSLPLLSARMSRQ